VSEIERYTHEFVEFIPDDLTPGVLYVSTAYATAVHLCMCGCGFEVTSPLSPQQWCMIFDGRTVSVSPSIGNWSFECQSHYWLDLGTVDWAAKWSPQRIGVGRAATRRRIEVATGERPAVVEPPPSDGDKTSWFKRLWSALRP
jgi:hypothetical protein